MMPYPFLDAIPLDDADLAQHLGAHLRHWSKGYRPEIKRRIAIRKLAVLVYYDMDDSALRAKVRERAAGFTVGWLVARRGVKWA